MSTQSKLISSQKRIEPRASCDVSNVQDLTADSKYQIDFVEDDGSKITKDPAVISKLPPTIIQNDIVGKNEPGSWWRSAAAKSVAASAASKLRDRKSTSSLQTNSIGDTTCVTIGDEDDDENDLECVRKVSGTLLHFVQKDKDMSQEDLNDSVSIASSAKTVPVPVPESFNNRKFGVSEKHRVVRVIQPKKGEVFTDFQFLLREKETTKKLSITPSTPQGKRITALDVVGDSSSDDDRKYKYRSDD